MRVLLIGSGGREHAIGWKIARSPRVDELISLPGNPGLATLGALVEGVDPTDAGAVAALAWSQHVDLVVVGPEAPLAAGVVDALHQRGIPVFGPSRAAARLESSKAYAKSVMDRAGVPTAAWAVFDEAEPAVARLRADSGPYVVKADGLAGGKGVLVTERLAEAEGWVRACLDGRFGATGAQVVVESFLAGPELSVFAVCDGEDARLLQPARDYKRLAVGDGGPNTGGMGAYSPVTDLPEGIGDDTLNQVVRPVLEAMAESGNPYRGFLYVGFVLTTEGPKVLEFNCRLGDPESQAVLPLLDTDLVDLFEAALGSNLASVPLDWSERAAVNVVLAAAGYPTNPRRGDIIAGADRMDADQLLFHAGTTADARGRLVTNGGRVLNVVGLGDTLDDARRASYDGVSRISWPGMQFRTDIAGAS